MAGIDGILRIAVQNAADELRLGTDEAPRMLRHGAALKLSIPPTSEVMLRHLLGELLDEPREAELRERRRIELPYLADGKEPFRAVISLREGRAGIDVVFSKAEAAGRPTEKVPVVVEAPARAEPPKMVPGTGTGTGVGTGVGAGAGVGGRVGRSGHDDGHGHGYGHEGGAGGEGAVSRELGELLAQAAGWRASDLHLADGEEPCARVDGALRGVDGAASRTVAEWMGGLLDGAARAALDEGRAIDRAFDAPGVGRVRCNVYRATRGLAAALRLLPASAPSLAELKLPVALDELVELPHGLVLVCGPTGSGKSSTLAALAQEAVHRRPRLLISLEDPVEFPIRAGAGRVRQRQIGRDVRDFPSGLRDALREDPDLLLIGELRDPETIGLALTAAETGHLVLASLHSPSAASSVERIVDAYPAARQQQARVQLADVLRAVVAQRLLPRLRGGGRVAAIELLRANTGIGNLIREGKTAQIATAIQSGRKEGMVPLERCLADLVRAGQVAREAALSVANDAASFASFVGG